MRLVHDYKNIQTNKMHIKQLLYKKCMSTDTMYPHTMVCFISGDTGELAPLQVV